MTDWKELSNPKNFKYEIDTESPIYRSALKAGWTFTNMDVIKSELSFTENVRGLFTCVCGNHEMYRFLLDDIIRRDYLRDGKYIDIAGLLDHKANSFSVKHLEKDGYSPEDIEQIRSHFTKEAA